MANGGAGRGGPTDAGRRKARVKKIVAAQSDLPDALLIQANDGSVSSAQSTGRLGMPSKKCKIENDFVLESTFCMSSDLIGEAIW